MEVLGLQMLVFVPTQVRRSSNPRSLVYLPFSRCRVGSNVVVAGTAIFNAEDPEGVIAQLKKVVDGEQARIAAERQ